MDVDSNAKIKLNENHFRSQIIKNYSRMEINDSFIQTVVYFYGLTTI